MKMTLTVLVAATIVLNGCVSSDAGLKKQNETDLHVAPPHSTVILDSDSSLDDYVKYALLHNPGLKAAFSEWQAAAEDVAQSEALPNPTLSYAYFIENVETRVGPQRQKIEVSQMFPWFGKRGLKGRVAAESAKAAHERYEAAKQKLVYKVKSAYFEYYHLSRTIATTERHLKLMKGLEDVVLTRYKLSATPHASIVKLQVELGRLENSIQSLRDLRSPMAAKLNSSLNRPIDSLIPWPKQLDQHVSAFTEKQAAELMKKDNPELKALKHIAAAQVAAAELAAKNYYPDLMLGAGVIDTGEASMPGIQDSGKNPVTAMVGISLPIWFGKYRAASREAKARGDAATNRLADRENALKADIAIVLYNYRDAERKISLYEKTLIPKATEAFEVSRKAFESGAADFIDVIDAERIMLDFQLARERALVTKAQKRAELEMLTGTSHTTEDEDETAKRTAPTEGE